VAVVVVVEGGSENSGRWWWAVLHGRRVAGVVAVSCGRVGGGVRAQAAGTATVRKPRWKKLLGMSLRTHGFEY